MVWNPHLTYYIANIAWIDTLAPKVTVYTMCVYIEIFLFNFIVLFDGHDSLWLCMSCIYVWFAWTVSWFLFIAAVVYKLLNYRCSSICFKHESPFTHNRLQTKHKFLIYFRLKLKCNFSKVIFFVCVWVLYILNDYYYINYR